MPTLDVSTVERCVAAALEEDLGSDGDITSRAVVPVQRRSRGRIVARQELTLAGLPVARAVFAAIDASLCFAEESADGERVDAGTIVATVTGGSRGILTGERTALNFLMRLSGIATVAAAAVQEVAGTGATILDTRKTGPGLRVLEKYAVACGGATNHRMGLWDAVMIKDTHLGAGIELGAAIRAALAQGHAREIVTAEVRTLAQLDEAIEAGAGRALLDNAEPPLMRKAVELAAGRIVLEVSGGLKPGRLREVAETGVDFLSLGALTHSAPAADLALEMEPCS